MGIRAGRRQSTWRRVARVVRVRPIIDNFTFVFSSRYSGGTFEPGGSTHDPLVSTSPCAIMICLCLSPTLESLVRPILRLLGIGGSPAWSPSTSPLPESRFPNPKAESGKDGESGNRDGPRSNDMFDVPIARVEVDAGLDAPEYGSTIWGEYGFRNPPDDCYDSPIGSVCVGLANRSRSS